MVIAVTGHHRSVKDYVRMASGFDQHAKILIGPTVIILLHLHSQDHITNYFIWQILFATSQTFSHDEWQRNDYLCSHLSRVRL